MTPRLEMVAVSDRGMVRSGNEDRVAVQPVVGLAVLADGMGGHNAGEVASGMAVELIVAEVLEKVDPAAALSSEDAAAIIAGSVQAANAHINAAGAASRERAGMGTTVVAALWHDDLVTVGHVGDSRLYCLRGADLLPMTLDHTLVQEIVNGGALTMAQARKVASRSVLTRAVGTESTVQVDVESFRAEPGDVYVLCSDGLSEMLDDGEIAAVLFGFGETLRAAADELVRRANENGGTDNVSVILVRAAAESAA